MSSPSPDLSAIPGSSFSATYMALRAMYDRSSTEPETVGPELLQALERALLDRTHAGQTCAQFMYRLAADSLAEVAGRSPDAGIAARAHDILVRFALHTLGDPCMAAARCLGTLPVEVPRPERPGLPDGEPFSASFAQVLHRARLRDPALRRAGRCFVLDDPSSSRLLVLKCAQRRGGEASLRREAAWMRVLKRYEHLFPARFELPEPLFARRGWVFRTAAQELPGTGFSEPCCLAFLAPRDYFLYPNEPGRPAAPDAFLEIMERSSLLFGWLASRGILHTDPVPLFHNRTQQTRRDDLGAYLWTRRGRLDRWLHSSWYPNFGASGLRDFEHFEPYCGSGNELFRAAGNQIMGLLLVAGSYFRSRSPEKIGLREDGSPWDLRDRFERTLLRRAVRRIFTGYYRGFTGAPFPAALPSGLDTLVDRMIEEMGVDRYMQETLRVQDQEAMDEAGFRSFLLERGMHPREASRTPRGDREITLTTGPHLGDFNQSISLPEIVDFAAGAAGAAVSGVFLQQRLNRAAAQTA
jgi:hypothetical protein